jgi:hypothetical protein
MNNDESTPVADQMTSTGVLRFSASYFTSRINRQVKCKPSAEAV